MKKNFQPLCGQKEAITKIILILEKFSKRSDFNGVALAGGKSPLQFYSDLFKNHFDWGKIPITVTDERVGSLGQNDRNEAAIKNCLKNAKIQKSNFITLDEWPRFRPPSVATLGFGTDGHIASIFPNMMHSEQYIELISMPNVVLTPTNGSPNVPRLTMNLAMLLNIKNIFLLYRKCEKDFAFKSAQNGDRTPLSYFLKHYKFPLNIIHLD